MIYLGVIISVNFVCLLVALWQAFEARKISTDLQESSYIFIAMALILIVSFVGVPVVYIAEDNTLASYFLMIGVIFIICTSVLVLIYVPKWRAYRKREEKKRDSAISNMSSHLSDGEGIEILWSPKDLVELESKVEQLSRENEEYKHEIDELKKLLDPDDSNEFKRKSVTFENEESKE